MWLSRGHVRPMRLHDNTTLRTLASKNGLERPVVLVCFFLLESVSLFAKLFFFNHLTSQNTAVLWVKQPCVSEIGALPSDEPWSQETPKEFLSRIALTSAAGEGSSVVISTNIFFSVKDLIHGLTHAMKAPYYWATFLALHVFVWIFLYAWDLDLNAGWEVLENSIPQQPSSFLRVHWMI